MANGRGWRYSGGNVNPYEEEKKPRYSYKVCVDEKLTTVLCKTKREARQLVEYLDVKGIDATITPVNRDNIHLN